jgi:aldose 1-epimerase
MRKFTPADLVPVAFEGGADGYPVRIEVLPVMGANLISLQVEGREYLHFDGPLALAEESHITGCFHMFPFPCSLRDCRYTFEGKEVRQWKHGQDYPSHGLLRDETFEITTQDNDMICTLAWEEDHPIYEGYPWAGQAVIVYRLLPRGLEVRFTFENRSSSAAPASYGIHPFWAIPGDRADAYVKLPTDFHLALEPPEGQLPTGDMIPVQDTQYDLRNFTPLAKLFIDDVFFPRPLEADAGVAFKSERLQVRLRASDNMRHLICYSPEGKPFVCVENLTAAPDAPNLYEQGYRDLSGMTVVPPGGKLEASVRYEIERIEIRD